MAWEEGSAVWIQTVIGAFSINCADTEPGSGTLDPDTLMIRGRRRGHLELLHGRYPELAEYDVDETPHGDYRWRIVAPKALVMQVVAQMVAGIDYKNFKAACGLRENVLGQGYGAALHTTWAAFARLQK